VTTPPLDGGPVGGNGATRSRAGKDRKLAAAIVDQAVDNEASPRPRTTEPAHDATTRQGLQRTTLARSSSGRCRTCGRNFETLAGAVSHGRAAVHTVEGVYRAAYLYEPTDDPGVGADR